MRKSMTEWIKAAQEDICQELSKINQKKHEPHPWTSAHLKGEGCANIFTNGCLLEKGGVNVSAVHGKVFGDMLKMLSIDQQAKSDQLHYFATGLSIVLHPVSPWVPTIHANYRYFEIEDEAGQVIAWFFGGGTDLTPYYLFEEDVRHFHTTLKQACDKTEAGLYAELKRQADAYFYLPHRQEHRGVGGIFSLRREGPSASHIFEWVKNCTNAFLEGYLPIVHRRKDKAFTERQKNWQLIRRGRYVEFNLLYDIGTQFGIKSGGMIENILMSLPPCVAWEFKHTPQQGSEEEKLLAVLKNPSDWI